MDCLKFKGGLATLFFLTVASGLSPSLNSRHTAPLYSAQIAHHATSFIRKTLDAIKIWRIKK